MKRRVVRQKAKGPIDPAFGQQVRALRLARGLTQGDLAAGAFTKGFISLLETGRTRASMRAAAIVAERLGVSVTDLVAPRTNDEQKAELAMLAGEAALNHGAFDEALRVGEAAAASGRGRFRVRALRLVGRSLLARGQFRDALVPLDEAVRVARDSNDVEGSYRALFDLALAHGRLDESEEALQLALEVERALQMRAIVDRHLELEVLRFAANLFLRLGRIDAADLRAQRALSVAADVGDPKTLADLYGGLAITREAQGDLEAALGYARRSLDAHERAAANASVAEAWNTIGWLYVQRKQFARAAEALDRADRLAAEHRHPALAALVLATRAELAIARGDAGGGERLASAALAHPSVSKYGRAEASRIRARAVAAQKTPLGRVRRAFDEAVAAHDSEPPRRQAALHQAYAEALFARGLARDAYEESRRAWELIEGRTPTANTTTRGSVRKPSRRT